MKHLFAFGLALIVTIPAAAQIPGQSGALGGNFASRGMSRPLGGISAGVGSGRVVSRDNGRNRAVAALPYAYSFYIPNYFDSFGDDYSIAPPVAQAAQQPPVIINQYFAAPPMAQAAPPPPDQTAAVDQRPGDPIGPTDNYYLIAYKNHSVYTALAYWVEDKTLHYVTTENTHNQASLDLIDLDLTKTLNQSRRVPFSIPGR